MIDDTRELPPDAVQVTPDPNAPDPQASLVTSERAGFTAAVRAIDHLRAAVDEMLAAEAAIESVNDDLALRIGLAVSTLYGLLTDIEGARADDPRDDGTWQNGESYEGRWA